MANSERQKRFNKVYINKDVDYMTKLRNIKTEFNLNDYQYDVVYKYIYERFSHASARSYIKGVFVKDISLSQKEAEKIYSVIRTFIEDNKVRLNELVMD